MNILTLTLAADGTVGPLNLAALFSSLIGGAVALGGNVVLERIRQSHAARTAEQDFRRRYHDELVNLVADSRDAILDLLFMLLHGVDIEDSAAEFANKAWNGKNGLKRRLQAIKDGHPDLWAKQAAWEVLTALATMVNVTTTVQRVAILNGPNPQQLMNSIDENERRNLYAAAMRGIKELAECIDGPTDRPDIVELARPRAVAIMERIEPQLPQYEPPRATA